MSPSIALAILLTVMLLLFLAGMIGSMVRTEALLRRQAADIREIARAEAKAECHLLGLAVAFQMKGLKHVVAETRQFMEVTTALVREIAGIDGVAEPAEPEPEARPS